MDPIIRIFQSPADLAEEFATEIVSGIMTAFHKERHFTIALSGGTTPKILFSVLADDFNGSIPWKNVHFFWGDERCVAPFDQQSNYKLAKQFLLDKINIPKANIHRIKGEDDPISESKRYAEEIKEFVKIKNGVPSFDLILLGMGQDGHVASIFPGQTMLLDSEKICEVSQHPVTSQKRITLTGKVFNNAAELAFLVTGKSKAWVVSEILFKAKEADYYPAAHILPENGKLEWLLDKESSIFLNDQADPGPRLKIN
jgi:6-phosphogluconolactonase